jgi:hypothetical protein
MRRTGNARRITMKTILRNCLAVVAGLVLGSMVNMALVVAGPKVVPPPAGVNLSDAKSLAAGIHLLEPRHFLFPFLAHAAGTLVGASVAYLTASTRRPALAYLVGTFFLAGGIAAAFMIPAPAWFITLDLLLAYLPMAWLGTCLGRRIHPGSTTAAT